ncbi:hypothetical protein K1719_019051 [Acacia pycnantha]|nr:hypothetical protein K1719_019051 [Acacia pycnantha]
MADSRVKPGEEEAAAKKNQISDMKSAEIRVKKEKVAEKSSPAAKSIWDSYESIVTHIIERHWMIFPFKAASSSNNSSSHHVLINCQNLKQWCNTRDILPAAFGAIWESNLTQWVQKFN